ncbi:tyrosine-type recombinase/integrase [Nonomuraea sp. NPDC005983]|uniref:tyrosine-type recombinase/integrase n=1 Tax=Nonomuraea sp. NPDC005983 TaxID=3155595 RepID=UPI0033B6547E
MFTTPQGRAIDPTNLTRTFTTLLGNAGRLRRIRFHDLRHSTATLLLEQGDELVVIKELHGSASSATPSNACQARSATAVRTVAVRKRSRPPWPSKPLRRAEFAIMRRAEFTY